MANTISIDVIFGAINKTGNVFGQVNKGLNGMMDNMWKVNQAADLLGRTSDALSRIAAPGKEYDFGLAELSAITGIAGKDLDDLGKTARKVGKESGLGATGSLEAYKLLASQIEVDKIGISGLNELQKRTITLAQASPQLGLAGAANSLAGTINQFGLEASQAGRVMNVLAAGSKYGAAEIPDLAQSFKVVGASAAAAGLDVETTGGAIEILSKNNLKGAEAGTALRNVLLKMQTDLGFDFKVTKLSDALATLQGKEGDAAYMSKIFGAENITAAQFLVKNAQAVDEMTKKMTGTNVATEQANIMNKTFTHWMDVRLAKMNDLSISFFQGNAGLLGWVQMGGQAAMTFTALSPVLGIFGKGITGTFMGISSLVKASRLMNAALAAGKLSTYSALIERYGMAGKIAAGGLKIKSMALTAWNAVAGFATGTMVPLIAQTWAWTAALMANPITWIVAGVVGLVAVIALAWKHFAGFRGVVVGAWEGMKKFGEIIFGSVLGGLKQLLSGIGKIGQAIAFLFKGQFKEAGKTAMEGFGDIAKGSIKMSPIGVVTETIRKRDEIGNAASAGYQKGKAIDTSNFLSSTKKKDKPVSATDMQVPEMNLNGKINVSAPDFGTIKIPGIMNMATPSMGAMKMPGVMDTATPDNGAKKKTASMNMGTPSMGMMKIPGVMNMATPDMGAKKKNAPINMDTKGVSGMLIPKSPAYKAPGVDRNLDQITKNITQNVANNNTTNQNTSNNKASKVEINYQPQVHVSANMTKENQDNLMKMLYSGKDQLMKLVKEELRKDGRLNYAG